MNRRCLECGRDISRKHPNAVFCSNKGQGNCKDRFHNRNDPSRLERVDIFLSDDPDEIDYIHPFSDDAFTDYSRY